MKKKYPLSRKNDIVVQEVDGEVLIYDLKSNKAFCLNETSALIWELCDGNKSLTDISKDLSKKLNAKADEGLVWLALEQLKKEKLIENEVIPPSGYEGMSRREAVRKVGLASLIAIPVIMSLNAPVAASSGSVCLTLTGNVCACTTSPTDCPGANPTVGNASTDQSNCAGTGGNGSAICTTAATPTCVCGGPFVCTMFAGFRRGTCG